MRLFLYLALTLILTLPSNGQSCYLQQDCGAGNLCSASGTCQPVRSVLDTGSNTLFWVDQASGNDANPGTESQPFRSITRAMQSGTMRAGDAVLIRQGTYYEPIIPSAGGSPGQRLTIAGYPGESVVISGAINLDGTWSSDGNAYRLSWPYEPLWNRYEGDSDPFGPARRRDVLIADGVMLQAVYNRSDLYEGAFFLEGSPYNPTTMYVMLPGGKDPNQAVMQTSRYNHLFNPSTNETNCRFGDAKGYYHVIGLTFRHTANDGQMGAVCAGTEGSILEAITVEWTNGSGFLIAGNNHIVRGVTAQYNGMSGIRGIYCDGCLLEYATSRYNNWKGYYRLWESGGGKWLYTTRSTFRNLHFHDNEGPGLWLDMDNFDNVIEQSRFDGNRGANVFLEWTTERTIVRNNVITRARYADSYGNFYGHGLLIHAANNNMIVHNTFMGNAGGGMRIRADDRDSATNNRYYNNLFIANQDPNQGEDYKSFEISFEEHRSISEALTNKGEGNIFWHRNVSSPNSSTFHFRAQGSRGGILNSNAISDWQSKVSTDYNSSVIDPELPHVLNPEEFQDGWRLSQNSQVQRRAVTFPQDITPLLVDFDGEPRPMQQADPGADQFSNSTEEEIETNIVQGDASGNGIITAYDASLVLQHASGILDLSNNSRADASGDGSVSAFDASLILQYITGYITCLPADNVCSIN